MTQPPEGIFVPGQSGLGPPPREGTWSGPPGYRPPAPVPPPAYAPPMPGQPTLPVEPAEYHHFLHTPAMRWWKPLVAIVLFALGFIVVSLLQVIPLAIEMAAGKQRMDDLAKGKVILSPVMLLGTNITLLLLIPISMVIQKVVFGQPMHWLHSVRGRFTWAWALRAAAIIVPIWAIWMIVLPLALDDSPPGVRRDVAVYLTIILVTTPLQAAGEEYGFRGLLQRSVAAWFRNSRIALVVGALLSSAAFMLVHGAGDPWLNVYYLGLGLIFCGLCWRTGGIEAAVVLHAVNNVFAFGTAVLAGQMDKPLDRSAGVADPSLLIALVLGAIVVVLVDRWFRRTQWPRTGAPGVDQIMALPPAYPPRVR